MWRNIYQWALENDRKYTLEAYYELILIELNSDQHDDLEFIKGLYDLPSTEFEAFELKLGI